jgi:translation elongation factor EF-Ts
VLEKIIEGKLGSYYKQTVLTDQDSIRDTTGKTSVKDVLAAANKTLGGTVSVTRFVRMKVGESAT